MATNITAQYQLVFKDLASRGLLGVANSAKNLVGKLSSVTGVVSKIGGAFSAISGVVVGSKLIGVQREFDVLNSSLLTAMGSTEAAAKKFKELNEFAQRTPYTLAQSVNGFVQLKNLGLDPSLKVMEAYGNMASAMGKDLSQMIEAVADAATFEFERLKEFGIKANQDSKKNTVSFTFQGQTKTLKRDAKNIQKYLLEVAEKFKGSMANRMATLDGAFANFGQNFNNVLLQISQSGIGDALKSVLNKASDYLTEFFNYLNSDEGKKEIDGLIGSLKDAFANLKGFVGPIIDYVKDHWVGFRESFVLIVQAVREGVGDIVDYLKTLKLALDLGQESRAFWIFPESIQLIVKAVDIAKEAFRTLGQWIGKLIQSGGAIKAWAIENKEVLIALGVGIGSVAAAMITLNVVVAVATGIFSVFGAVVAFITSPITLVIAAVVAVIAAFTYFYRTNETFRNVVQAVWEFVKVAWQKIGDVISTTVDVVTTAVSKWWNFLKTGFTTTFTYVGDFVSRIFDGIKSAFYAVINFVIEGVNKMIRGLNSVSSYVPGIGSSLQINEFEKLGVEHTLRSNQVAESRALVAKSLINMTMTVTGNVAGMDNFQANLSTDSYKSSGGNNAFVMKQGGR